MSCHSMHQALSKLTKSDLERMTKVMTAGSEHLPILPPEAFERESFYEDDRIKYS